MKRLLITLLGSFHVTLDGEEITGFKSQRVRALLAYLAVEQQIAHSRNSLAALFWPDWPDQEAHNNLRYALYNLRQAIRSQEVEPQFLIAGREMVQFNPASDSFVDVASFIQFTQSAKNQSFDPDRLKEAIGLYQGEFLEGFAPDLGQEFDDWVTFKRAELNRIKCEALGKLADHYESLGEAQQALVYARRLVEVDPWQENGHRRLMRLLANSGESSAALLHYEHYRLQLEQELGVNPDEETQELFRSIQQKGRTVELAGKSQGKESPKRIGECPYRGLSAFQEQDAPFYFGREEYVEHLLRKLNENSLVVVLLGSSGSGKSSLIYAGLLPKVRSEKTCLVLDFRPGMSPFCALASALMPWLDPERTEIERLIESQKLAAAISSGDVSIRMVIGRILAKHPGIERFLLFIDQFEELYTLCTDEEIQRRFLDALLQEAGKEAGGPGPSIIFLLTLRADFMGRALSYRPFADALQDSAQMLGPMSQVELRAAVEKPAQKQGVVFEEGLVDRILKDVGDQPGNLPLLEFALTLLWEEETNGLLRHAGYEKIGRVEGALTRYAEKVYSSLKVAEQAVVSHIIMQLIQPGRGTEDTRRIANRDEIGEENWPLVQYLADKRLVVTSRDGSGLETVEIVHEALIQRWDRLKKWLEVDRSFRIWQETLRANIRQWVDANRDDSGLLRGVALTQAENWLAERQDEMSALEKQFIQQSVHQRLQQEQEQQAQQQRELEKAKALASTERRARRFLAVLAGVLVVAVILTAGLTIFANQQRSQALAAYSLSLAASAQQSLVDLDSSTALSLALAANKVENPPRQAQTVLMNAAYAPGARSRQLISALFPDLAGTATCLDISPQGDKVLFGMSTGALALWNPASQKYQALAGHSGRVTVVKIAPDGLTALSGGEDHQVIYWDLRSGSIIHKLGGGSVGHSGTVRTLDFSPNGKQAVSGSLAGNSITNPGELILWDLGSGNEIHRFKGHINGVIAARFTPDGTKILASSGDMELDIQETQGNATQVINDLILWDVKSGEIATKYGGVGHDILNVAISPDGSQALLGSYYNNLASLIDLASGKTLETLSGHRSAVRAVNFLPDGQRALSASDDGSLILWNLASAKPLAVFKVDQTSQIALASFPDGSSALSINSKNELFRWDLEDAFVLKHIGRHNDSIFDVDFSPDGKKVLSCSGSRWPNVLAKDASLRLWDIQTGRLLQTMAPPVQVIVQCAISPDGRWALSGSDDGIVRLWDLETGQLIRQMAGNHDWVNSLAFAPDGKHALTGFKDGSLIYWDLASGLPVQQMASAQGDNWMVAISPDGQRALSDAAQGGAIYWNLATGTEIRRLVRNDTSQSPGESGGAFLPNGLQAVTGEDDGNVILWDLQTGKEIRRFGRHDSIRTRVEVSRDGKTLLTSGMDGVLRLWNLASGEMIRQFGYSGLAVVFDIRISPDGATAISGSIDQTVTLWSLMNPNLDELKAWIDTHRYVRDLTCAERASYQIEPLCSN
ncbi:MAG TPA: BTAD domain-containing putative transcriptional regulator [Anaerolineaceae bacterium]|nr:BTAD domain-containing putative transcriptional regulator [Anaerolineaceae bacterium]